MHSAANVSARLSIQPVPIKVVMPPFDIAVLEKKFCDVGKIGVEDEKSVPRYRIRDVTYEAFKELLKIVVEVKAVNIDEKQLVNMIRATGKYVAVTIRGEYQEDQKYIDDNKKLFTAQANTKYLKSIDEKTNWLKDFFRDLFSGLKSKSPQLYTQVINSIEQEVIESVAQLSKEVDTMPVECKELMKLNFKKESIRNLFLSHAAFQENVQQKPRRLSAGSNDISLDFRAALIRSLDFERQQSEIVWRFKDIIFTEMHSDKFIIQLPPLCAVLKKLVTKIKGAADCLMELADLECYQRLLSEAVVNMLGEERVLAENLCERVAGLFSQLERLYDNENVNSNATPKIKF